MKILSFLWQNKSALYSNNTSKHEIITSKSVELEGENMAIGDLAAVVAEDEMRHGLVNCPSLAYLPRPRIVIHKCQFKIIEF